MKQILATALFAFTLSTSVAAAAVVSWSASLAPENEVPPVVTSSGSGVANGTFDTITNLLSWTIEWADLTGAVTAMHFHGPASSDQNAGVVIDIGAISGLNSPSVGSTVIDDTVEDYLLAGLLYINVHTQANPGGEIRGQVVPAVIPLPASLPMLLLGLLVLGRFRRRV